MNCWLNDAIVGNSSNDIGMHPDWDDLRIAGVPTFGLIEGYVDNVYLDSAKWTSVNVNGAYNN